MGKRFFSSSSSLFTSSFNSLLPWPLPIFTASIVEAKKRRIASSTCCSVAIGESEILARDSVIRMIASSWRTVIGMEDRALASSSAAWTCLRIETKWEESFSAASGDNRGAQRLLSWSMRASQWKEDFLRFAVADITLHLIN